MIKKVLAALIAMSITIAMVGCSNSDSSSVSEAANGTSSTNTSGNSRNTDSSDSETAAQLYFDDIGPYYYNSAGEKVRLSIDYSAQQQEPIYGHYDIGGVSFDIPDGYCADNSMGIPIISASGDLNDSNNILVSNAAALMASSYDEVTKDSLAEMIQSNVDSGMVKSFKIEPLDEKEVNGVKTKSFKMEIEYPSYTADNIIEEEVDEDESVISSDDSSNDSSPNSVNDSSDDSSEADEPGVTYYSEYTILDTATPYFIALNAEMDDEAIKKMQEVRDYILNSIKIDVGEAEVDDIGSIDEVTVDSDDNTYVFDMDDITE